MLISVIFNLKKVEVKMLSETTGRPVCALLVTMMVIWYDQPGHDWKRGPTEEERDQLFRFLKSLGDVKKVTFVNNVLLDGWALSSGQLIKNLLGMINDESGRWWLNVAIEQHTPFYNFVEEVPKRRKSNTQQKLPL
jgi:hypothetical protein